MKIKNIILTTENTERFLDESEMNCVPPGSCRSVSAPSAPLRDIEKK